MDFVQGVPIDRYCEERCIEVDGKLKLFQVVSRRRTIRAS